MAEMRRFLEEESEAEKKKRDFDPNVGGGVDREKLKGSDFVFSDERTFPVVTPGGAIRGASPLRFSKSG